MLDVVVQSVREVAEPSSGEGAGARSARRDLGGQARCAHLTALRCSVERPAEETRYAPSSLRSDSLGESDDEARAARVRPLPARPAGRAGSLGEQESAGTLARPSSAALLDASHAPRSPRPRAFDNQLVRAKKIASVCREGPAAWAAARVGGAEQRRRQGRARSALRHLTRRDCLSVATKERSEFPRRAARPSSAEQSASRSEADRRGRAPQPAPPRLRHPTNATEGER